MATTKAIVRKSAADIINEAEAKMLESILDALNEYNRSTGCYILTVKPLYDASEPDEVLGIQCEHTTSQTTIGDENIYD